MVAPPKIVTFADDVAGGSGGAGSTLSRNRTNIFSKALPTFQLSSPFGTPQSFNPHIGAPQPSGQFAAYHQSPFGGGNVQPTSNPQPSFGPSAFGQLPAQPGQAYPQHPFSGGNVQPAAYPRPAFGQPAAYQQSPFVGGNVQPATCTQNVFGFPNQQSNRTSGQASTALFGAPQIAYGSNCSSFNGGMSGQVSATSNLSGSSTVVGVGQAFVDNQQVGSRKSPYSPTTETDITCRSSPEKLTSISAMKVYSDKSHEELRLEDYQHQRSQVVGGILSCVEADKDEDIIALAEFAVEQHKALYKDDCAATFTKVVVACLEPFEGGRYHIVLDTVLDTIFGFMPPKRHYAVVLRKCTPRANNLTVLEKWLSS